MSSDNKIQESLGLEVLDDLLYELETAEDDDIAIDLSDSEFESPDVIAARDHEKKLDEINRETISAAKNITALGFQVDHSQASKILEQAANFYKVALEAVNAKREYRQRDTKLKIDEKRLEHLSNKSKPAESTETPAEDKVVARVVDRNTILEELENDSVH